MSHHPLKRKRMFDMGVVPTTIVPPRVAHRYLKRAIIEELQRELQL